MIRIISLQVLISCTIIFTASAQNTAQRLWVFPKFKVVFDAFYEHYNEPENSYVEFVKRPEGYFIREKSKPAMEDLGEYLFWSAEKKGFVKLPEKFDLNMPNTPIREYYAVYNSFDRQLYHNYPGAASASIKALEGKELNDTLHEALARAYSRQADLYIGERLEHNQLRLIQRMDPQQLEGFLATARKSIGTYQKLVKQNPNYETIVGKAGTKLSNEYVYFWNELTASGYTQEAREFLPDGLYDPLVIGYAKNTLSACPLNTILFTVGDNDTYPLWYVQEKLHYRTDVAVINSSLSGVPFYIVQAIKKNRLPTTLDSAAYYHELFSVLLFNFDQKSLPAATYLNAVKDPANSIYVANIEGKEYLKFPPLRLEIPGTGKNKSVINKQSEQFFNQKLQIAAEYLYESDVFELDVLVTNNWKRPVAYTAGTKSNVCSSLKDQMEDYGFIWLVNPLKEVVDEVYVSDTTYNNRFYKLLMQTCAYDVPAAQGYQVDAIAARSVYNFVTLASVFGPEETTKAKKALEKAESEFRLDQIKEHNVIILLARCWLYCGETERGSRIMNQVMDRIAIELKTASGDKASGLLQDLGFISTIANQRGLKTLAKRANMMRGVEEE